MAAEPKPKLSHQAARYRPAKAGAKRRCGTCAMFVNHGRKPPHCTLVADPIRAAGDCDYFEPR